MTLIAAAGLSARALVDAAVREGFEVIALDLFGDVDTRAAARQWLPIGEPAAMRIDDAALIDALRSLAQRGDVAGWIVGSGFEGRPDLLERGSALLPLIGNAPDAVRSVRDPATFFAALDAAGIGHPEVRFDQPIDPSLDQSLDPDGWLLKDAGGCGGWQVRRADAAAAATLAPGHYLQRQLPGEPMSATFVANGRHACVLGFNRLLTRGFGAHPFVFCGAIGPVSVPREVDAALRAAADALSAAFGLRGLGSIDFMRDGSSVGVLEVNPRPPASIALYRDAGVVRAHLQACLHGELPPLLATHSGPVEGFEIVFARRALRIGPEAAARLAVWPRCHDRPAAGVSFGVGDPVCTLAASGDAPEPVRHHLQVDGERLLSTLESLS